MNEKEKAEAYVRTKLPELMELSFGCEIRLMEKTRKSPLGVMQYTGWRGSIFAGGIVPKSWYVVVENENTKPLGEGFQKIKIVKEISLEIIGHPIQLQQWLQALDLNSTDEQTVVKVSANMMRVETWAYSKSFVLLFNLATGQPATEADYQAFNQIIGNI
jgi:hypothetical protein